MKYFISDFEYHDKQFLTDVLKNEFQSTQLNMKSSAGSNTKSRRSSTKNDGKINV